MREEGPSRDHIAFYHGCQSHGGNDVGDNDYKPSAHDERMDRLEERVAVIEQVGSVPRETSEPDAM